MSRISRVLLRGIRGTFTGSLGGMLGRGVWGMEEPFLRRGGIMVASERDLLVEHESHRQGGVMVRWSLLRCIGLVGGESPFLGLVVVIC